MSSWTTPKTDWDVSDYYNYSDLNRVESNTEYIKDELVALGYSPTLSTITTTRTNASIDFYDDINRVESNIKALADASYTPLTWETPKTSWVSVIDPFDYSDANRLENNLSNLKTMVENIEAELEYCGILICGESFHLGG
jgi:hypothetical protein